METAPGHRPEEHVLGRGQNPPIKVDAQQYRASDWIHVGDDAGGDEGEGVADGGEPEARETSLARRNASR